MKKIIFVTKSKIPNGDAGALRYAHLAYLFQKLNYSVEIIGMGKPKLLSKEFVNDVSYVSMRSGLNLFCKFLDFFLFTARVNRYIKHNLISGNMVLIGGTFSKRENKKIKKMATNNHYRLLFNIMEWYSPNKLPIKGIVGKIGYLRNINFMEWFDSSYGSVISISTHLHNHFTSKGVSSFCMPFVMDHFKLESPKHLPHEKTIFLYIGHPGNKDDFNIMLKGFDALSKNEKKDIQVILIGISKYELTDSNTINERSYVQCLGKISHEDIGRFYSIADYTVLMRPPYERYSKSGFPTKFTESLFYGIPVITNLTSDIGKYIIDDYNGLIVNEYSYTSFTDTIRRAINKDKEEKKNMKLFAYNTAIDKLDITAFEESFRNFINSL